MKRKELYSIIKERHYEEGIKTYFRKNFTQVSNKELEDYISRHDVNIVDACTISTIVANLVGILNKKRIILDSEVEAIFRV